MTKKEILNKLEEYGDKQTKRMLMKHGAEEPCFGVKVQDLKKILKKIKLLSTKSKTAIDIIYHTLCLAELLTVIKQKNYDKKRNSKGT